MNTPQWERVREIFDAALDLPAEGRSIYVRSACGGDENLREEVEELLAADNQVGSFLETPWFTPQSDPAENFSLREGDVVSGRFRIIKVLGNGGMGRVYEAHDSELGVQVALKTLHPQVATNPEVLLRFRQEVRIAHLITHPNVCRTFHLDREQRRAGPDERSLIDLTFITMEYLDGETLQQQLKRSGPLPIERALSIARQMAEAIEAAHQMGVIHRDIKPGNVMICPSLIAPIGQERVVITDFGLAKLGPGTAASEHTSISQPGRAMGTLAYMAPEQLEGAEAGPATDIYAFGLVLYEMVTGTKAFPDANSPAIAYRRLVDPPPSPSALGYNLPARWETAISGCLQVDPAARFQHAANVIATLEGDLTASNAARRTFSVQRARSSSLTRHQKWIAGGLGSAILVSLLAVGIRLIVAREAAAVAPGALVYLAPTLNRTGEKQLDNVSELVKAGLEQSAHVNLLDSGRVADILQQMTRPPDTVIDEPTAREIAMRAHAARVVFTTLTGSDGNYHLRADVQQPDNTPFRYRKDTDATWGWQSPPGAASSGDIPLSLLGAVRDASQWIRHTVGESANDVAQLDAPAQDVTTASWNALREYTHAQQLASNGDDPGAVLALKNAVAFDPAFALAYGRLGDILFALHQNAEGLKAYNQALATGADRRLSRRERDRIQAMYAFDTGDYQAADVALRDAISFYQNDPLSWAYRVEPLKRLGRPQEAIDSLNKVLQFKPDNRFGLTELANTYMFMGDYQNAARAIDRVRAAGDADAATELEGHLQFLQGHFHQADATFAALAHSTEPELRIKSLPLRARVSAEEGDWRQALAYLDKAATDLDVMSRPGFLSKVLLDRAAVRGRLGNAKGMLEDVDRAVTLNPTPNGRTLAANVLGQSLASTPDSPRTAIQKALDRMLSEARKSSEGLDAQIERLRIEGELRLARNDWQGAADLFRKAANLDAAIGPHEYLGRALTAGAARQTVSGKKKSLQQEALQAYAVIALKPGILWNHPMDSLPGSYAEQLQAYVELAAALDSSPQILDPASAAILSLHKISKIPGHPK